MPDIEALIERCRLAPGTKVHLKDRDAAWSGAHKISKEARRKFADDVLARALPSLAQAQELLWASDTWSLLLVLQAMDTAGKDGIIKHVMSGVNPMGCQVYAFKQPSAEELDHNFLWRCARALPERGRIGIFNRSYYEEVLIAKVHPELIANERIPRATVDDDFWQQRYDDINQFERHLTRNGTVVLKFFLHLSRGEQRKRLLKRLKDPAKHWKFSASDLTERAHWDEYMHAYEQALTATSTDWAPWYVIPADHKWVSRALVAAVLTRAIAGLGLSYPEVTKEQRAQIARARQTLRAEKS